MRTKGAQIATALANAASLPLLFLQKKDDGALPSNGRRHLQIRLRQISVCAA